MLTPKQVNELKEHLERAQNPVFFFDNDQDGLCSFLLLQRYLGRGKGVAIKSYPSLDVNYFRKIKELNADYVFILDKPDVSEEFWKEAEQVNIPLVWIDHHYMNKKEPPKFVNYYNPAFVDPLKNEPVTALCYGITKRKEDLWLAIIGCIADGFLPDFYNDFAEQYPELSVKANNAFEVLYKSKLGEVIRIFGNGLKDNTTNVVNMLRFLAKAKSPYDLIEENTKNYALLKRSAQIDKKYQKLFEKAKKIGQKSSNILFFKYSGDLSISAELANELCYTFKDKVIVVAYTKRNKVNLSLRGKKIKDKFLKAISGIDGARGGGHEDAVGGQVDINLLDEFRKKLEEEVGNIY